MIAKRKKKKKREPTLPLPGAQVLSLGGELRFLTPFSKAKINK